MIFDKATIVKTLGDKIDSSARDAFLKDEMLLTPFEDGSIAELVNNLPEYEDDEFTEKEINKVVNAVTAESYDSIEDIVLEFRDDRSAVERKGRSLQTNRAVDHSERIENQIEDINEEISSLRKKLSSATSASEKEEIRKKISSKEDDLDKLREAGKGAMQHLVKHYNTESYSSIEDIVNGSYEESLFTGISEKSDKSKGTVTPDALAIEKVKLQKYADTAKGEKKASYLKRIAEIEAEQKAAEKKGLTKKGIEECAESVVQESKGKKKKDEDDDEDEDDSKESKKSGKKKKDDEDEDDDSKESKKSSKGKKKKDDDEDSKESKKSSKGKKKKDDEDVEECTIESIVRETELSTATRNELPH